MRYVISIIEREEEDVEKAPRELSDAHSHMVPFDSNSSKGRERDGEFAKKTKPRLTSQLIATLTICALRGVNFTPSFRHREFITGER
jgi:hypothetical protein